MFLSTHRPWLASLACSLFLSAVADGQNPKPALGQIVRSSLASIGGIPVPSGGTVVSGDALTTAKAGGALLKFSATSQLEVYEDTRVTLNGTPGHLVAKLDQGTVTVTAEGPSYLAVETPGCRIEPSGPTGASYSVTLPPRASAGASISASQGSVSLVETASSSHRLLAQGQTAVCPNPALVARQEEGTPTPSQSAGQAAPPAAAKPHGSNTTLWLLLLGGGAAAGLGAAVAGGHGGAGAAASSSGVPASPSGP